MLDTPKQVEAFKEALRKRISDIANDRDEDRKQQRYWERKGVPAYANLYRLAAQEKTQEKLRRAQEEEKQLKKRIAELKRNERTHRLCTRGGYLEKLLLEQGDDPFCSVCSHWCHSPVAGSGSGFLFPALLFLPFSARKKPAPARRPIFLCNPDLIQTEPQCLVQ